MPFAFDVITIFPNIIEAYIAQGIIARAIKRGLLEVSIYNLRDFSTDKHKSVDDYPYGGGCGMVMKVEPFYRAINFLNSDGLKRHVILLSPQGNLFRQQDAVRLSKCTKRIVLLCGRYEGIDERVTELLVDEELSIGDYVISGGELPALVVIDAVSRLLPQVLGNEQSNQDESFSSGLLEYPQYTRPAVFAGLKVPDVLLSGNHAQIAMWRKEKALQRTKLRRPDLKISDISANK